MAMETSEDIISVTYFTYQLAIENWASPSSLLSSETPKKGDFKDIDTTQIFSWKGVSPMKTL